MTYETTDALELQARGGFPLRPFVPRRYRPGNLGTWSGHLAFASDLILSFKPSLIVELGTHFGESYFGFCQTVLENGLPTLCYAVDHWLGEEHAGFYGEEVYQEVARYNESNYKTFSYLIRSSFDDAARNFSDGAIDLLHIDGLHTYEAVRHDFETWLPKVRPGGLVLLHDTAVRHKDFGVWRFWEELEREYAETFFFRHWWGLGVVRKPGGQTGSRTFLDICFHGTPEAKEGIRRQYSIYAGYLENLRQPPGDGAGEYNVKSGQGYESQASNQVSFQLFPCRAGVYTEEGSIHQTIETETWHRLSFDLSEDALLGRIRIDPADRPCFVELSAISVKSITSGTPVWKAEHASELRALEFANDLLLLPPEQKCLLFSYGSDPVILLPEFETPPGGVVVEVAVRIENFSQAAIQALHGQIVALQTELKSSQSERMLLSAQLTLAIAEQNNARSQLRQAEQFIERLQSDRESSDRCEAKIQALELELARERATCLAIQNSKSWKITKPLRDLMRVIGAKS